MSDLKKYIQERRSRDTEFAKDFDSGCQQFKIGATAKQCGGGGGGKPDRAQAGGKLPEKLAEALANTSNLI